jgi:hypothetical protein
MSTSEIRTKETTADASVASVDMKLEVIVIPSRMSIAPKSSTQGLGGASTQTTLPGAAFAWFSSHLPVRTAPFNSA